MKLATNTQIDLARQYGLGAAVVVRCIHVGRVAPYVEQIARAGDDRSGDINAGRAAHLMEAGTG